jgi:hypothetical protein
MSALYCIGVIKVLGVIAISVPCLSKLKGAVAGITEKGTRRGDIKFVDILHANNSIVQDGNMWHVWGGTWNSSMDTIIFILVSIKNVCGHLITQ